MRVRDVFGKFGVVAYAISALIPLSKSDAWWIRIFDFPRLQLLFFGLILGMTYLVYARDKKTVKLGLLSLLVAAAGLDLYRILPYTTMWPKESLPAAAATEARTLSLFAINVLQDNEDASALLNLIKEKDPDIVLLLEVNARWLKDMAPLESKYPYLLKQPQENTYGLALYSRLKMENAVIKDLIEPEVPSVQADVVLPSGERIRVYGLHPRPPHVKTGPTTERDAELIQVAKAVRATTMPAIVIGDLNDVAWSHTTRLFRRISGMLDPRVGRGPFSTFPVGFPLFRFPLDYVFHSSSFTLNAVELLADVGSDHFPVYIELTLEPAAESAQEGPELEEGDMKEAQDTIQRAKGKGEEND